MGPSYHYFWTAKIGSSILTRIHISLVDEAWGMKVTSTSRRLWIIKMIAQMNSAWIFKVFWRPSNIHIHIFMLSSWAVFKKVQKSYYFNYYFNAENNTFVKTMGTFNQIQELHWMLLCPVLEPSKQLCGSFLFICWLDLCDKLLRHMHTTFTISLDDVYCLLGIT